MKVSKKNRTKVFQAAVLGVVLVLIASWIILAEKDLERRRAEIEALGKGKEIEINVVYLRTDVHELIDITSVEDVNKIRKQLIKFLWESGQLPNHFPSEIEKFYQDDWCGDISRLHRIDRALVKVHLGMFSGIYHLFPKKANGGVII